MANEQTPDELKERLARAVKSKAVLAERSKRLQEQADDLRRREDVIANITTELLDRQRELNLMLHRANSFVHQLRDANLALSSEFKEMVKELPAAKDSDWESMVSRVNDLFEKTHELAGEMEDELFRSKPSDRSDSVSGAAASEPSEQVSRDQQAAAAAEDSSTTSEVNTKVDAQAVEEASTEPDTKAHSAGQDPPISHEERMDRILVNLQSDEQGQIDWRPPDNKSKPGKGSLFSRIFGRDGD